MSRSWTPSSSWSRTWSSTSPPARPRDQAYNDDHRSRAEAYSEHHSRLSHGHSSNSQCTWSWCRAVVPHDRVPGHTALLVVAPLVTPPNDVAHLQLVLPA